MTETASPVAEYESNRIVAGPGRYYRTMRFIMVLGILGFGAYFLYDGFIGYPRINARLAELRKELGGNPTTERKIAIDKELADLGSGESGQSIATQKALGFALPAVAIAYMVFFLRRSRGQVIWENGTLHHPGHPPLTLAQMTSIENKMWKKKGIAYLKYDADGKRGVIRLDTFFHDEKAMDAIYDIIAKHLGVWEPPSTAPKKPAAEKQA